MAGALAGTALLGPGAAQGATFRVDPGETRDLAAQNVERVTAYRDRLERWAAAQKAALARR